MRSSLVLMFLILLIVAITKSQNSQYQILEDNPYKNIFSFGVGIGLRYGSGDETLIELIPKTSIHFSKLTLAGVYNSNLLKSPSRTSYEFLSTYYFLNADEIKTEDFHLRKQIVKSEPTLGGERVTYEIQYYQVPMTVREAKGIRLGFSEIRHLATTENTPIFLNGDIELGSDKIVTPMGKYEYRDAVVFQESQTLSKVAILGYCSEKSIWIKINSKNFGEVIEDSKSGFFADILYAFYYTFDDIKIHDNFLHIISEDLGPHGEGSKIVEPVRIDGIFEVKKEFRNFNPWGIRLGFYQTNNTYRKESASNIRSHFTTTFSSEIGIQPGPSPIRYYWDILKFSVGFSFF
jgi:hypothetical protein